MNKKELKEYQKEWRKNHPDYHRKWVAKHKKETQEYMRDYFLEHHNEKKWKEKHRKYTRKYRARLKVTQ